MITQKEVIVRLLLSIILGGIIGIERESVNRPAGFRTHVLVCVGSTLTMLVSIFIFEEFRAFTSTDPSRIAAQVVSGIGFLGAGTIIRVGPTVKGLTTAASLWTVASIGLAIGCGFYSAAVIATIFTFITLISLTKIEVIFIKKRLLYNINLTIVDRPGQLGKIGTTLGEFGISIRNVKMEVLEEGKVYVNLTVRLPSNIKMEEVIMKLSSIEGVQCIDM
ncbi:MAG: MgtC/SapB family protein [Thermovenabulum sp.]|uniref:MgtC/SapB family protein n=1 Tax=Thermovenabulum sp. TaxID=3100335 RepID=UPI003C7D5342